MCKCNPIIRNLWCNQCRPKTELNIQMAEWLGITYAVEGYTADETQRVKDYWVKKHSKQDRYYAAGVMNDEEGY